MKHSQKSRRKAVKLQEAFIIVQLCWHSDLRIKCSKLCFFN